MDTTLTGGITVGGSLSRGTYTVSSNYVTGADNIVLKGNSSGVSGIFFESETNGSNINHPSDFGFIQYFPYGIGGTTGESNRLVIGTSNDADDIIVLNPVASDGVKVRVGAGTTEYTVYHSGNIPTWNQNTTGTASNITAYTINQSVGTGNSPSFAGLNGGGAYFTSQGTANNSPSSPSANIGVYAGTYAFLDLSTSDTNGSWIDFSKANGTDFSGRIRYENGTDALRIFTGGTERFFVNSSGLLPLVNNTYNLGSAALGWANVYTNDLHLSNMNKPEGNDVDGTNGNWTIQEGDENLYIINNNNGKKFKISLEEIK